MEYVTITCVKDMLPNRKIGNTAARETGILMFMHDYYEFGLKGGMPPDFDEGAYLAEYRTD